MREMAGREERGRERERNMSGGMEGEERKANIH